MRMSGESTDENGCTHIAPRAVLDSHWADLPIKWVGNEDALYQLIDEIDGIERVALDTEFIKRTTYFPILALIQVNTGRAIYLVDAPRLDLTEFWQALTEIPQMIWYACGEDLAIFYLLSGCAPLSNVIDVQIGMAYLTGSLQMGYARALHEVFSLTLAKTESQSDWLHRPLSEAQERYAADDVRYLLALHDVVTDTLKERGIEHFVAEDTQYYAKELHRIQNMPDDEVYLDLLTSMYTPTQIAILQNLATWREKLARSTNQPRSFIISRQALREIVLTAPTSIKLLARTTLNRGSLRMYGEEMVTLVKEALSLKDEQLPPMAMPKYSIRDKALKNKIKAASYHQSQRLNIPEPLLLKNRWLTELCLLALAQDGRVPMPELSDALKGYRHQWIMDEIVPLLYKHRAEITLMEDEQKT